MTVTFAMVASCTSYTASKTVAKFGGYTLLATAVASVGLAAAAPREFDDGVGIVLVVPMMAGTFLGLGGLFGMMMHSSSSQSSAEAASPEQEEPKEPDEP